RPARGSQAAGDGYRGVAAARHSHVFHRVGCQPARRRGHRLDQFWSSGIWLVGLLAVVLVLADLCRMESGGAVATVWPRFPFRVAGHPAVLWSGTDLGCLRIAHLLAARSQT